MIPSPAGNELLRCKQWGINNKTSMSVRHPGGYENPGGDFQTKSFIYMAAIWPQEAENMTPVIQRLFGSENDAH